MRLRIGISALLVIATVAVFAAVRDFGFLNFDDHLYVLTNPNVRSGITLDGLRWLFSEPVADNWHPLTMFSLMLDVEFFGVDPGAMHGVNLVIHLANTLLVFWLLALATGANGRSALCAAIFALHPLRVESVAWIAERKDVLFAFFWLCATGAYARYALRRLGWIRAASPDASLRAGERAVALFERAAAQSDYGAADDLDGLAAALAEAGRFEPAAARALQAAARYRAAGDAPGARRSENRAQQYGAGVPLRLR